MGFCSLVWSSKFNKHELQCNFMKIDLDERVVLEKTALRELAFKAKQNYNLHWSEFKSKLGINSSTLRECYSEDNRTIAYSVFLKLCKFAKVPLNKQNKMITEVKEMNWNKAFAGSFSRKNKKIVVTTKIKISKPPLSDKLAEFAGIAFGDGSIYMKNYTLQISLDRNSDYFYLNYVTDLIKELFSTNPKIYDRKSLGIFVLRVNSKELIDFLINSKILNKNGKKQVPQWILSEFSFLKSFFRGLFDTDGSLYLSNRWCVLNFSSSEPLIRGLIIKMFKKLEISVIESHYNINATSLWKIKKFLSEIGTSNLKNVIKFLEYLNNRQRVLTNEVKLYSRNYVNFQLPYFYRGDVI